MTLVVCPFNPPMPFRLENHQKNKPDVRVVEGSGIVSGIVC